VADIWHVPLRGCGSSGLGRPPARLLTFLRGGSFFIFFLFFSAVGYHNHHIPGQLGQVPTEGPIMDYSIRFPPRRQFSSNSPSQRGPRSSQGRVYLTHESRIKHHMEKTTVSRDDSILDSNPFLIYKLVHPPRTCRNARICNLPSGNQTKKHQCPSGYST
jgi:hypothetical protein